MSPAPDGVHRRHAWSLHTSTVRSIRPHRPAFPEGHYRGSESAGDQRPRGPPGRGDAGRGQAGELLGLYLVDDHYVGEGDERLGEPAHARDLGVSGAGGIGIRRRGGGDRRGIEQCRCSGAARGAKCRFHGGDRHFELGDDHRARVDQPHPRLQMGGAKTRIGARRHRDLVVSGRVHHDQCHTGCRAGIAADRAGIDSLGAQVIEIALACSSSPIRATNATSAPARRAATA